MAERSLVVDHLKFSYEGLFNAAEIYNIISSFFYEKGYDWYEKMNQEQITPSGKQIHFVVEPWKNTSDYYRLMIRIKVNIQDAKEVQVDVDGQELKVHQGLLHITFDGYVDSDRKDHWALSKKPLWWFLSVIFEKYFFKDHKQKFETWVKSDVEDVLYKVKTYLNTYKYHKGM